MAKPIGTVDIANIRSPRIQRLAAYWEGQRAARSLLPRRSDVTPDQLRDLLPYIMIVDVEQDPQRFRYRLVGTRVVQYNGFEFTGRYLGEIGWPEEQQIIDGYAAVVARRTPIFGAFDWELLDGSQGRCEFARFPLSEDGTTISQVLAMEDYDFPHPDDALPSRP